MKLVTPLGSLAIRFGWEKALKMAKEAGFDAFDCGLQTTTDEMDKFLSDEYWDKIKKIKALSDEIGLPCLQAHGPFDDDQREFLPAIIRAMEYAAYLGAEVIVVHPMTDNYNYYERVDELFEENMLLYRKLIPHAERLGIKVAVENMYGWDRIRRLNIESACSHSDEFMKYVDTLNSEYIVACVDTGHANIVSEKPENMLKRLGNRVGALHVHDNTGIDDAHKIPFFGDINWDNVCEALAKIGYSGNFTFETSMPIKYMDDEMVPHAVKYMAELGKCLIRKIETAKTIK